MVDTPKVAIIEPVGGHGGMHYYDFGLAGGLVRAGLHVTLYTCDATRPPPGAAFEVQPSFRGVYGKAPRSLRALRYIRGLLSSLLQARRQGVRIAHFHFFQTSVLEWLCLAAARALGLRTVVTAHDVASFAGEDTPRLARPIYRLAERVIVHNAESRRALLARMHLPEAQVRIIPHGDYSEFIPPRPERRVARARLGLPADAPVLLLFGQIKAVKGLDLLLESLPAVAAVFPGLRLLVAGRPWKDDLARYRTLAAERGVESKVNFHAGFVADGDVPFYYQAADLVVLPYRRIYQSGVLLMAMSYARPVLVSDLPGMLDIVEDGRNGLVFRAGDAQHLAERLIQALSQPERLEALARAGQTTLRENHNWTHLGRLTRDIYHGLESL